MSSAVASGILKGRLFGGISILIIKILPNCTSYVVSVERYAAIRINDCLIVW